MSQQKVDDPSYTVSPTLAERINATEPFVGGKRAPERDAARKLAAEQNAAWLNNPPEQPAAANPANAYTESEARAKLDEFSREFNSRVDAAVSAHLLDVANAMRGAK